MDRLVESNKVEFKSELNDKFEKEVVAFLNYREGGDIYIGIDDDGNPVDIGDVDQIQLAIKDRIKDNILPATLGLFDVVSEKYQGKMVIHVIISSGAEKPYYIRKHGMSPNGCFIRIGTSSQPMTTEQIDTCYAKRTRTSLRSIISPRQKLSFEQLQIYYQSRGLTLNARFAESLDLVDDDGKYNYIAYLLSDENGMSYRVAKYAGTDKVDLIENEEYGYCSVVKAAKNILDKLAIENRTFTKITDKEREERKLVEPIALREAVINAFVHNDYTREITPLFEIFSDRLVITSYGGLPTGLSREEFFGCRSMARNRELMRIFKDLDLVEQLGSGMSRILKAYDRSVFEISENFLVVTFRFDEDLAKQIAESANKIGESANKIGKSANKTVENYEQQVIEYLTQNERINAREAGVLMELGDSRTREILSDMVAKDILIKIGKTRGVYYMLKEKKK